MSLRTLMQAGPTKANELFAKLSETSDGAIKTREKFFSELKAELELHINLEEQHLFPVLRRNAETKDLVAEAIKDNKELRAKLAELEALPKNDEAFPERLKELQKTFRQHARDDKRELLPAVQRALSEEQVQSVVEKIEAGVAEADKARQDEVEARRLKARQEREETERRAAQQAAAERARNAAAEQARQEEAEQKRAKLRREREEAEQRAEQQAAAKRVEADAQRRAHEAAEVVARTAQRLRPMFFASLSTPRPMHSVLAQKSRMLPTSTSMQ
jgi:hemerythrin superfamily protein